jgi:Domain of unknown function (DUF222)
MSSRGTAGNGSSVDDAFDLITRGLDLLTAGPWWQLSGADLAAAVVQLHAVESRVAFAQIDAVGEAISRGLPAESGAKDGAGWLRGLVPVTPGQAWARAGLAEGLHTPGELTPVRDQLAAGVISPGHAGVVVRTLDALEHQPEPVDATTRGEVQELLLDTATRVDAAQLGKAGQRARHRLDPHATERLAKDEDAQQEASNAYLVEEASGMVLVHALLPRIGAAIFRTALDPLCAPRPAADGTPDARTKGRRTADAMVQLAELALAARPGQPGSLPTRGGSPIRCHLTTDLATMRADLTRRGGQAGAPLALIENGEPGGLEVSPLTTQTLACDAEIIPMLLDDDGRVLDVGTTIYPFPPRIRRAIEQRDRHCTYPSCTAPPSWCHAHHLIPHLRGGPTAEANGALLCGRHHRYVHAHGWIGTIDDGHVLWRTRGPDDPDPLTNAHLERYERELRQLAQRWLTRRGRILDDTG